MAAMFNQEIARIQNWVADWCGTTVENCPFVREDVRDICRGPMRDVLLDLITTSFRTDDQIKVIRSNLYLNDTCSQTQNEAETMQDSERDEQLQKLKHEIERNHEEKTNVVNSLSNSASTTLATKLQIQTDLVKNLSHFELLETNTQLLRNHVNSTSALLQDIDSFKPNPEAEVTSATGEKDISQQEHGDAHAKELKVQSHQLSKLNILYNHASELFNNYFLQKYLATSKQSNTLSPEIQALSTNVSALVTDLTRSGISPRIIEDWARLEQSCDSTEIRKVTSKFTNVMNHVEEMSSEVKSLYAKLMKVHISLYFHDKSTQKILKSTKKENQELINDAILQGTPIVPAVFLGIIHQEEVNKSLAKCRELTKKLRKLIEANNEDHNLLSALGIEFSLPDEDCSFNTGRSSVTSAEGTAIFMKRETLEDLARTLIKSYPQSKSQLNSTIQQCRSLVLVRFPKVNRVNWSNCMERSVEFDSQARAPTTKEVTMKDINIPHELLFNNYKLSSSLVHENNECNILLGDVFKMQSELEKRSVQCELLAREDTFSKLLEK